MELSSHQLEIYIYFSEVNFKAPKTKTYYTYYQQKSMNKFFQKHFQTTVSIFSVN